MLPHGVLVSFLAAAPALAAPLIKWNPDEAQREASEEEAQEELADIQARIDRGDLPRIQFDLDSFKLREEAYEVIDLIADLMTRNPRLKLRITAHTCALATRDYNMKLSRNRAKSVKEALVKRGVPPPSIRFTGRGPDDPIATNRTEEGRERNRRVEFHLLKRDWSSIF
ncbi:MAG: OmpA family protein [Elusimicrobia bacterium]|nr:OmpA family protein [Elusimicrobiota bacterium]